MFTSNYPNYQPQHPSLLPTPVRVGAHPDYNGKGIVIAFIDSGFTMHPDLGDRVIAHIDATTNPVVEQPRVLETSDLSWHGQMTSVIAAGDGRSSEGRYRGIACGAQLVLIKVSDPRGHIKERDILRGLRWLIDTHRRFNIRIVNLSVGGDFVSSDPNHPLYWAVRKLTDAGIVVVAASGNHGQEKLVPPASAPNAITVGGYDDHNTLDSSYWRAYHSDYGKSYDGKQKPELVAPAAWIASPILPGSSMEREAYWLGPLLNGDAAAAYERLVQRGYRDLGLTRKALREQGDNLPHLIQARINSHKLIDEHHQHVDGTSVAAPIVSSVVAQMLEANPALVPEQVCRLLIETARPLDHVLRERQGAGALRAADAVQAALTIR